MKKAVLSASGGMDSTGLLLNLLKNDYEVYCISFDYGQKHKIELDRLSKNIEYLNRCGYKVHWKVCDISSVLKDSFSALTDKSIEVPKGYYEQENMKETVVPNRNAIFASITYSYALSIATKNNENVKLALGVHSGDHAIYPDCRPEFYDAIFKAFRLGNWKSDRVDLYVPYINADKTVILKDSDDSCEKLNLNFDTIFANTCTSYDPDILGKSNGKTGSDIERILAFYDIGKKDPVEYIESWDVVLKNALKSRNEFKQKASER